MAAQAQQQSQPPQPPHRLVLHFDGGSKGNPGISGAGYVLREPTPLPRGVLGPMSSWADGGAAPGVGKGAVLAQAAVRMRGR
ncbi:hypothetical protein B484DRAFT_450834 [Ochromonadaceae sp. CCMP2298]|nr:hypothetical protein B484DRAFT_450834 [Ochromonadaceae sp. CCMP2298]